MQAVFTLEVLGLSGTSLTLNKHLKIQTVFTIFFFFFEMLPYFLKSNLGFENILWCGLSIPSK